MYSVFIGANRNKPACKFKLNELTNSDGDVNVTNDILEPAVISIDDVVESPSFSIDKFDVVERHCLSEYINLTAFICMVLATEPKIDKSVESPKAELQLKIVFVIFNLALLPISILTSLVKVVLEMVGLLPANIIITGVVTGPAA